MFFYLNFLGMYEGGLVFIFIDLTRTRRVCVNGKTESPKMSTAFLFGLSSNFFYSRWLQVQDKFKGAGFCCKTEEDILAVFFFSPKD